MARTFNDQLDDDLANAFLNADEFGEAVTYYPAATGIGRLIDVEIVEETVRQDTDAGIIEITTLQVTCRRDSTAGIDSPKIGDGLKRSGETIRYAYTGEARDVGPTAHTLTYRKEVPVQYGKP